MEYSEPRDDGSIYAYTYDEDTGEELLRDEILDSRDPIYECHSGCACSKDCRNRVVERGRKIPLDLFRTSDGRGWGEFSASISSIYIPIRDHAMLTHHPGVYCRFPIKRGQFIDRYVGEIITAAEADVRRNASGVAKHKDIYLFALDKFTDVSSNDPRLSGPPLEVDGEYFSGPTRFINHSCEPNLRIFARVGDYADKHLHDLAFFAIRDIPAETELTFDYVDGEDTDLSADARDPSNRTRMTKCLCKSENCRGYLW
jgi:histone-lysine N-methyltransferase SUV39H